MAAEDIIEMAKRMIEHLEFEIQSSQRQVQILMEMSELNRRQLQSWKSILAVQEQLFINQTLFASIDTPSRVVDEAALEGLSRGMAESNDTETFGSKMALVRQLLSIAGFEGATPRSLMTLLEGAGAKVSASFAGNALHKMKQRREVVQIGGKYYLPMFVPDDVKELVKGTDEQVIEGQKTVLTLAAFMEKGERKGGPLG